MSLLDEWAKKSVKYSDINLNHNYYFDWKDFSKGLSMQTTFLLENLAKFCESRLAEEKKMADFILNDQLKCLEELKAEAFARGRLEAGKEIFNKIDKLNEETEECKYFFRGLEDLKTRFLSVSKEKVKK